MLFELFKTFSFWTYNSALGLAIRESKWGFASLEVVHLFGLTILLGSLVMLSLRYLGLTMRKLPINRVARELAPVTAIGLTIMIGSGVFLLPRRFGVETGVLGALIAWGIAGTGMLMLAFVFQRIS